jgi:MYXO-CTERM domain-containing protein
MAWLRWLLGLQGTLYVVAGAWPLVHMASFEAVTGAKTDDWLVYTVGLLLVLIGAVLLGALRRRRLDGLVVALAIGTALVLAGVELVHVLDGTIDSIYLADAAVEALLALMLVVAWRRAATEGRLA